MKNYEELTFVDDFMFCKVMENEKICKGVIESLLGIKVGHVKRHESQFTRNVAAESHGIRLDVYLEDSDQVFDIEMQTVRYPEIEKRIRYYQSVIDVDHLQKGKPYSGLPESYVVFICTSDPFDSGEPVYTVRTVFEENKGITYNDGTHKVLFNASAYSKAENPYVKTFLKYVSTFKAESELTSEIHSYIETCKGNEKWRTDYMTLEMKILEEKEASFAEGKLESRKKIALKMMENGLSLEVISGYTEFSTDELNKLRAEVSGKKD